MATSALQPLQTPPEFFPIMPWDPLHGWDGAARPRQGIASIAECHFTVAGFVKPGDLPECEAYGMKALVFGTASRGPLTREEWKALPPAQIEAFVRQSIEDAGASDAILGYYLLDEPGATLFPKLAAGVAAVRQHAPGKLAYINLFPGYATIGAPDTSQLEADSFRSYLERFVAEVRPQLLSYDNYMVQYSMDLQDAGRAARYFADLLEVRAAALRHGLPFWNIVSSNQIRPTTTIPSPANLALQAYTTLAAGGRGVTWYTYASRGYGYAPIDPGGNRTPTWQYLQAVNRQLRTLGPRLNRLRSRGVFFTPPPPVPDAPVLPGTLVTAVQSETPAMVGEFAGEQGEPYALVVNLDLAHSARMRLALRQDLDRVAMVSPEDGAELGIEADHCFWLPAGQGALLRLR